MGPGVAFDGVGGNTNEWSCDDEEDDATSLDVEVVVRRWFLVKPLPVTYTPFGTIMFLRRGSSCTVGRSLYEVPQKYAFKTQIIISTSSSYQTNEHSNERTNEDSQLNATSSPHPHSPPSHTHYTSASSTL